MRVFTFFTLFCCAYLGLAQLNADFEYTSTGCAPDTVQFTNTSTGAVSFRWQFGNSGLFSTVNNPVHIYEFGTYGYDYIVLTAYDGLGDSMVTVKFIKLQEKPYADFNVFKVDQSSNPNSCLGEPIYITSASSEADTYDWSLGDGTSIDGYAIEHIYSDTGNYNIQLIVSNQCFSDTIIKSHTIDLTSRPSADFAFQFVPHCTDKIIEFKTGASNNNDFTTHLWDFGDGTMSDDIVGLHAYAVADSYSITLYATNACGTDTFTHWKKIAIDSTLYANSNPQILQGISNTFCPEYELDFYNNTEGAISYYWELGDGNFASTREFKHAYTTSGDYTVMHEITNTCGNVTRDSLVISIDVSTRPTASIDAGALEYCPSENISFVNSSYYIDTLKATYAWDFGDGNTANTFNAQHSYADTGDYTVELILENQCENSDTATLNIDIKIDVYYELVKLGNGHSGGFSMVQTSCINTPVKFEVSLPLVSGSFIWDFGDGITSIDPEPTHVYAAAGKYNIVLIYTDGCGHTLYRYAEINIIDKMPFFTYIEGDDIICTGEAVNLNAIANISENSQTFWDFGNGDTSSNKFPEYIYDSSGVYTITAITSNGCSYKDTATKQITVNGLQVDFGFTKTCIGSSTIFSDSTNGMPTSWSWDFGDGNLDSIPNTNHTYDDPGTYIVSLGVFDGGECYTTVSKEIIVADTTPVVAAFSYSIDDLTVAFTDNSQNADEWMWNFGDGNSSTEQSPTHIYSMADDYNVQLIASNACGNENSYSQIISFTSIATIQQSDIKVFPNPFSNFISIDIPEEALMKNLNFELYDIYGRLIHEGEVNGHDTKINLDKASVGTYILAVKYSGKYEYIKLIKSR